MATGDVCTTWPPAASYGGVQWAIAALEHSAQVQAAWQGRLLEVPGSNLNATRCTFCDSNKQPSASQSGCRGWAAVSTTKEQHGQDGTQLVLAWAF